MSPDLFKGPLGENHCFRQPLINERLSHPQFLTNSDNFANVLLCMSTSRRFLEVKLLGESIFTLKILMFAAKWLSKEDMSFPA